MNDKSGTPVKMKIFGYSDEKYSAEYGNIEVQINPAALKYGRKSAKPSQSCMFGYTPSPVCRLSPV